MLAQSGRLAEGCGVRRATALFERAGLPLGELHVEQADALVELRLLPEAQEQTRFAVRLLDSEGVPLMAAEAQLRVAQLTLLMGEPAPAAEQAEQVADRFRRQRRASWAARADLVAVEARLRAGTSRPADSAAARRAAATLHRSGMPAAAVQAGLVAGRVAAPPGGAGRPRPPGRRPGTGPAARRCWSGCAAGWPARWPAGWPATTPRCSGTAGPGWPTWPGTGPRWPRTSCACSPPGRASSWGGSGWPRWSAAAPRPRCWSGWSGPGRRRWLAVEPADAAAVEGAELAAMRAVQAELRQHEADAGSRAADGRRAELVARQAELVARQAELEARIRQSSWTREAAAAAARPPRLSPALLRSRLGDQVLVEYDMLDGELLAAVVEPRRTRLERLGPVAAVRFETSSLLFALRRLAWRPQPGPATRPPGGPPRSAWPGCPRCSSARSGWPTTPAWWWCRSASRSGCRGRRCTPRRCRSRRPRRCGSGRPGSRRPAAAGRAGGRAGLPGGVREIELLGELYPDAVVLHPPDSTADAVTAALAGADLAHLACHGRVRADNPIFSALLLSDGPLTVHELELRGAGAGCRTGSCWPPATPAPRSRTRATRLLGFVSALLARGSARAGGQRGRGRDLEVVPLMGGLHGRSGPAPRWPRAARRPVHPGPDGPTLVRQLVCVQRLRRRLNRTTSITRVKRYSRPSRPLFPREQGERRYDGRSLGYGRDLATATG